jgi:hypothetical protein
MSKKAAVREIIEMLRTSLCDDDTEDVALYIGMQKYLNLVEAYIKLRELLEN